MARRKTVASCVGDIQSKSGDDEKEPTRRLNVQISESAFEALMIHLIKFAGPSGISSRMRSRRSTPSSTSTATRSGAGGSRGRLPPSLTGKRIGETFTVPLENPMLKLRDISGMRRFR